MPGPERTVLFVYNTGLVAKLVGKAHYKGKTWSLGAGTFTMGREPGNNLVLEGEPGVSKVHCKITLEDKKYVLLDAESRNGTLLNGTPIKRAVLKDGDEIRVCNVVLGFEQELAMPESDSGSAPLLEAGGTDPFTPPATQAVDRSDEAKRPKLPPGAVPQRKSSVGYFLFGMLLCFVGVGGGALYLGVLKVDGLSFPTSDVLLPNDVPPRPVDVANPPPKENPTSPTTASGEKPPEKAPVEQATTSSPPPVTSNGAQELSGVLKLVTPPPAAGGANVEVKHTQNARVNSVAVKVGKDVRKGAVLLVYDDSEAQRRLATARVQYDSIKEVAATQDTDRARKVLGEARVDLERAQAAVANLKVFAPSDGVVSQVLAEAGKRAGKGTTAVVMSAAGTETAPPQWKVTFKVPVDKEAKFRDGATVTVSLGNASASGFVESAEKAADGITITAVLAKELAGAKDGSTVKVK